MRADFGPKYFHIDSLMSHKKQVETLSLTGAGILEFCINPLTSIIFRLMFQNFSQSLQRAVMIFFFFSEHRFSTRFTFSPSKLHSG